MDRRVRITQDSEAVNAVLIVSNTVTHNVGDVARASDTLHRTELGIFGWSLATEDVSASQNPVG